MKGENGCEITKEGVILAANAGQTGTSKCLYFLSLNQFGFNILSTRRVRRISPNPKPQSMTGHPPNARRHLPVHRSMCLNSERFPNTGLETRGGII